MENGVLKIIFCFYREKNSNFRYQGTYEIV